VVVVVYEVLVVYVYVMLVYVGDVRAVLTVSTSVELAVKTVIGVTESAILDVIGVVVVVLLALQVLVNIVIVVEVETALDIEYTVLVTVGPSGCLSRPILLPPYSANHTLTTPVAASWNTLRPWGFAPGVIIAYSEKMFDSGEYLPILLA